MDSFHRAWEASGLDPNMSFTSHDSCSTGSLTDSSSRPNSFHHDLHDGPSGPMFDLGLHDSESPLTLSSTATRSASPTVLTGTSAATSVSTMASPFSGSTSLPPITAIDPKRSILNHDGTPEPFYTHASSSPPAVETTAYNRTSVTPSRIDPAVQSGQGANHYPFVTAPTRLPPILQVEKKHVTTSATQVASAQRRRNEASFVCPVPNCGSTFTRRFNLNGHLRSHTEERPYVCERPDCNKSFARQHDCKRHMALHDSEKAQHNVCKGCKKSFSRLDALNRHLRSSGGESCRNKIAAERQTLPAPAISGLMPMLPPNMGGFAPMSLHSIMEAPTLS